MKDIKLLAVLALGAFGLAACDADTGADMQAATSMPSVQEQACLAGVSNEANNGEVSVLSSEFSEANSALFYRVGSNGAPWRCLVSNDGRGAEVMFMGSEGAA